jgi:hypothetical protein
VYKLITAANSSQAYQLKSKLNSDYVLLGDYHDLPDLLLKTNKVIRLPNPKRASYTHEMLALCIDKDIDTIYALRKQEKVLLLNAEQLFQEYNINIQVTDNEI